MIAHNCPKCRYCACKGECDCGCVPSYIERLRLPPEQRDALIKGDWDCPLPGPIAPHEACISMGRFQQASVAVLVAPYTKRQSFEDRR